MKYRTQQCIHWIICLILLITLSVPISAQTKKKAVTKSVKKEEAPKAKPIDIAEDEKRVQDIITFLQYLLNTLGSSNTSVRDKEVLITESYSKIFRDNKVQIEDDLVEARLVVTNKDIVPYLKDVDFFFKDVTFEFIVEEIKSSTLPNGELFYRASTRRVLTGTTSDGKIITNTIPRFIEVNYNTDTQDLKIVSIYTNEFNEAEALASWWKDLSLEWKLILKKEIPDGDLIDSLQINDLKAITTVTELDLSENTYIQNIEPLGRLLNLTSLIVSGTQIGDLTPIRNLTELTTLDLSHTTIADLSPLKYSNKLLNLNISHTLVTNISVLEKMPELQALDMNGIAVTDFSALSFLTKLETVDLTNTKIYSLIPIQGLVKLRELDLSGTPIRDLSELKNLKNLEELDIDSTLVSNLDILTNLESLIVLRANYSAVKDLVPLQKLKRLEKVYVDYTAINREAANNFISVNPSVQVIFDSEELKKWWDALSPEWQGVFSRASNIRITPSKEELAKIPHLDSINIIGGMQINNLEPLRKLQKLQIIIANQTTITDLSPLQAHTEIQYLDISETNVKDISILQQFNKLKILRADKSKIEDIDRYTFPALELFYADNTTAHDIIVHEFLKKNPKCLIIYKTIHLDRWWNNLSENWKDVFKAQMKIQTSFTRENIHQLVEQERLHINDAPVNDLNALSEFVQLNELHFSGTAITSIPPLENIKSLTSLHATNGPLQEIGSLGLLTDLEDLDISNTPLEDLKVIRNLLQLKKLNCAGTQVKRLDYLEKLAYLEILDCSNTSVRKLDPLDNLPLKTLTCYNTKISNRTIEKFKLVHPDCQVVYYR
ncbi:MAG: leucine-rich repeat domain-containing protein [Bacteroidia bacterium]|nr:leucine-rich repeat domain-containing protein [Bacteroidia bacterium]